MNEPRCETVRDGIPDFVAGRLPPEMRAEIEAHVSSCEGCRSEADLVGALFAGRRHAPEGLAEVIIAGLSERRAAQHRPWWGLSAAAVAALALGIGITSRTGGGEAEVAVPGYAVEVEEGALWVSDDGLVAGAPSLDMLSDEALAQLLDELTVGSSGGAA